MDKRAYNRAHRRMVADTFSPGWTQGHRARRGYVTDYGTWGDEDHESHGKRGRRKTERPLTHRQRGILDHELYRMVQNDDAPMLRPGQMTNVLVIKVRRIQ